MTCYVRPGLDVYRSVILTATELPPIMSSQYADGHVRYTWSLIAAVHALVKAASAPPTAGTLVPYRTRVSACVESSSHQVGTRQLKRFAHPSRTGSYLRLLTGRSLQQAFGFFLTAALAFSLHAMHLRRPSASFWYYVAIRALVNNALLPKSFPCQMLRLRG